MTRDAGELLPGTFEMLTLKALSLGAMHGWGVAERIERLSGGVCEIQQGAVYPVFQRLLRRGWVVAEWRATENNRRAKYYRLTAAGKRQLEQHRERWSRATFAVTCVLEGA